MLGSNSKDGLGGLLKFVNDATKTVNDVKRTADSVKRAFGGNSSSAASKNQAQPAANTAPAAAGASGWICACGTSNTTKFCGGCGKALPAATPSACPKCGKKRPKESDGMKFCGECGTKFK